MKVPETYYDEIFDYCGQWDISSKCGLKILSKSGKTVVIVTELYQDNPGTSVTSTGGKLIHQICEKKNLAANDVIYLECNPDTHSVLSFYDEEYFHVTFQDESGEFKVLKYTQLSRSEVAELFS